MYLGVLSPDAMAVDQLKNLNENELMHRLQLGDIQAFDHVFEKFYNALCFYATRLTSDRFAAEEIVQDIFYKLWNKHADFISLNSIKAFLYISTRNASINFLNKEQRKIKHDAEFGLLEDEFQEPVINEIIYTEVLREIAIEVDALPEQCAKIIKMIFEDGLQPKEVADKLNITTSTVYNQKMRGLSILKKRLSGRSFSILTSVMLSMYFK